MTDKSGLKRKKIEFQKLVDWRSPYPTSVLADVFQWMVKTGWEFRDRHGVFELMYGLSSHGTQYYHWEYGLKFPDWSLDTFLKAAFVRAVVAEDVSEDVNNWRRRERIALGLYRMLELPEHVLRWTTVRDLNIVAKRPLTTQLNSVHPKATEVKYVLLSPGQEGWMASVHYGYDGSVWRENLIQEHMGFSDAVVGAIERMNELTA